METYLKDKDHESKGLNLITYVETEPAHNSDANALMEAIESTEHRDLKPDALVADSLYGSDSNYEQAKQHEVELIAPTMGAVTEDKLSLSEFEISDKCQITVCPQGHKPKKIKRRKLISVGFASQDCENCPNLSICPVQNGKNFYYLRFSEKQIRIAKRRAYEESAAFKERYRWRAGVEATMSEFDRRTGIKHLRVRGLKAVKYCVKLKALAINIFRAAAVRIGQLLPADAYAVV